MYDKFGVKELYEVSLKTTDSIEINGKSFESNEVFMYFDKIQLNNILGLTERSEIRGGKYNFPLMSWQNVNDVTFDLEDGLINRTGFNLVTQSEYFEIASNVISVPKRETLVTDATGKAIVSNNVDINKSIFVYKISEGIIIEKLTISSITNNEISLGSGNAYTNVLIDYYFKNIGIYMYEIGGERIKGFFKLTAKVYFVDEKDGTRETVLMIMPKVQLMSNIGLTFGIRANPIVSNFRLKAFPDKDGKTLARFFFLNQDIEG